MPGRLDIDIPSSLVLRCGRNWTAVGFFGLLAALHLANAVTAFIRHRYDAFMSVVFGGLFLLAAIGAFLCRAEVTVIPAERRIRLRVGYGRVRHDRFVPFSQVRSVRVTVIGPRASVEVVCRDEEIECPPTNVPCEEALLLAMLMGVHLVKVIGDGKCAVARPPRVEGSGLPRAVE